MVRGRDNYAELRTGLSPRCFRESGHMEYLHESAVLLSTWVRFSSGTRFNCKRSEHCLAALSQRAMRTGNRFSCSSGSRKTLRAPHRFIHQLAFLNL